MHSPVAIGVVRDAVTCWIGSKSEVALDRQWLDGGFYCFEPGRRPPLPQRGPAVVRLSFAATEACLDGQYFAGLLNHDESFEGMCEMGELVVKACVLWLQGEGHEVPRARLGFRQLTELKLPVEFGAADVHFLKRPCS